MSFTKNISNLTKTIMKHFKLLTIILALSVCSTISAQKKGDVNVDGKVDISDIVAIINIIAE